jgi:hypothetical protein
MNKSELLPKYVLTNIILLLKSINKNKNIKESLKKNKLLKNINFIKNIKGGTNLEFIEEEFKNNLIAFINHLNNDNNQLVNNYYRLVDNMDINYQITPEYSVICLCIFIFLILSLKLFNTILQSNLNTRIIQYSTSINELSTRISSPNITFTKLLFIKQEEFENINRINEKLICCICTQKYDGKSHKKCLLKPCNHIFCKKCLEQNCNIVPNKCSTCSMCRANINYVIIIKNTINNISL